MKKRLFTRTHVLGLMLQLPAFVLGCVAAFAQDTRYPVVFLSRGGVDTLFTDKGQIILKDGICDVSIETVMEFTMLGGDEEWYYVKADAYGFSDYGRIRRTSALLVQPQCKYPYEENYTKIHESPSEDSPYSEALLWESQEVIDVSGEWIKIEPRNAGGRKVKAGWISAESTVPDPEYYYGSDTDWERTFRSASSYASLHPLHDDVVELVQKDTVVFLRNDVKNRGKITFRILEKDGEWYKTEVWVSHYSLPFLYGKIKTSTPLYKGIPSSAKVYKEPSSDSPYVVYNSSKYGSEAKVLDFQNGWEKLNVELRDDDGNLIQYVPRGWVKVEVRDNEGNYVLSGWI